MAVADYQLMMTKFEVQWTYCSTGLAFTAAEKALRVRNKQVETYIVSEVGFYLFIRKPVAYALVNDVFQELGIFRGFICLSISEIV